MKYIDGIHANPNYHPNNHQIRKWLKSLKSFGHIYEDGTAVLIVPNWRNPSKTQLVVQK